MPAGGVAAGAAAGANAQQPAESKSNTMKYLLFGGIGCAALVVIACAAILVALVLLDDDGDPTPVAGANGTVVQSTASTDTSSGQGQVSGETFQVSDVEIGLIGVREGENEVFAAEEGNMYIVAEFQVTNTSSEPYTLSTLLQFDMIDVDGTEYSISIFPEMSEMLDGDIPAGQTKRGEVGFEVPQNKGPYTIRFSEFLSDDSAEWVVQQP